MVNILSLTSTLSGQKIAHLMPNNIMGSHGKYVGKCTVFVGICCEMVVDNLLSEIFMIVEQRLWPKLYRFKWQNACARKKTFGFGFHALHVFAN